MSKQVLSSSPLHDFIDESTLPLDLVASWESLCDTYDVLRFHDEISDQMRLEEYKWIIQQMNCFLTRIRKSLMTARDHEAALEVLKQNFTPSGKTNLENRKSLAYQKLRQRWIMNSVMRIQEMQRQELEPMKEDSDGWTSYGIE